MATTDGLRLRPAEVTDLAACATIWRDALNDYFARQGRPEIPPDVPAIGRLHAHTLATDPQRFWVAEGGAGDVAAFGSAVMRGPLWFLSMLFVRPGLQARGVGRALLERIGPPPDATDGLIRATATDSGQPVSNGLYGALGMSPRLPLFNLVGRPTRPADLVPLPAGIGVERHDAAGPGLDDAALQAEIYDLDRAVLGFGRPADHDFVRAEGRSCFVFRDGAGGVVGYGYTSEVGRVAPVTVRDAVLLAPVLGHLLTVVEPRGASAAWLAGAAGEAFASLVGAGLRIEDLPVLLCWDRPFADFSRAVPISPGLL
jgi:GNAT superfamily N-acetyltransferase